MTQRDAGGGVAVIDGREKREYVDYRTVLVLLERTRMKQAALGVKW